MKIITTSSRRRLQRSLLCRLFAAVVLIASSYAIADYQDPLDTPAQKVAAAPQSLLLDVNRSGERLVAVGERGHILYSDDQGASWVQALTPVSTQLNAVFFVDDKLGWAVGEDAVILHSSDGGTSWQKQFDTRNADMRGAATGSLF